MWFTDIARVGNPGRAELVAFVTGVETFLHFVLQEPNEFNFLWEDEPGLRGLALETFQNDVRESAAVLRKTIPGIPEPLLRSHGLLHRPVKFKFSVLDSIGRGWESVRGQFSVREWLKRMFEAIDAILDSLIHAAAGVGGLIKEFKDALLALIKTKK